MAKYMQEVCFDKPRTSEKKLVHLRADNANPKQNDVHLFARIKFAEDGSKTKEYLLPEFKHLDFLWLLKGDTITEESLDNLIQSIRSVNKVQLVVELTNEKIRNKEHLIF